MCIDICPVGALTSGAYRYKTRPWEMKHVGTTCTHCADGCKTTLGVRRAETGMEIVRGDNRDKSGINGDFLCIKGRYGFDFSNNEDRLTQPLVRRGGRLVPATWEEAFEVIGKRFKSIVDREGGRAIGVIGSTRTTNEENYLLQKFARLLLGTNNIDHHRTADFPSFAVGLVGIQGLAEDIAKSSVAPDHRPKERVKAKGIKHKNQSPRTKFQEPNPRNPSLEFGSWDLVLCFFRRLGFGRSEPISYRRR